MLLIILLRLFLLLDKSYYDTLLVYSDITTIVPCRIPFFIAEMFVQHFVNGHKNKKHEPCFVIKGNLNASQSEFEAWSPS